MVNWILATLFQEILKNLFIAIADGDVTLPKNYTATVDNAYFVFLYYVGTMYAHKAGSREQLLHGFHTHK